MRKIVVTGASGFLGRAVAESLNKRGLIVSVVTRRQIDGLSDTVISHLLNEVGGTVDWLPSITGQDVVIHCAGRAHILRESAKDPLSVFRAINVDLTLKLANEAAAAKVKRFVFISSIGVNGGESIFGPFKETDVERPHSPYAQSKFEAETGLWEISKNTGMEIVIIRSPLIYGPSAPGNFGWLVKMVSMGIPLPFKLAENSRSLVSLENIVEFIFICATLPSAANQLFLVSDGHDLSTKDIVLTLSQGLGVPPNLINIPSNFVKFILKIAGLNKVAQSLYGNLQVDIAKSKKILNWDPPQTVENGFRAAVKYFKKK